MTFCLAGRARSTLKLVSLPSMITSARVISYVFHPLFLFFYLIVIAYHMDPFGYESSQPKAIGLLFIMSFFTLILFPAVTVALLKALNFIPSWSMPDKEHRIAPLIGTCVFYIWYFVNVKNNVSFPPTLVFVALGGAIAAGIAFFINNFSKISLHTVGAGSFLMATSILAFHTENKAILLHVSDATNFQISTILIILMSVLLAGLVGSARLLLKAHNVDDIYGGYIVGIIAQLIAYNVAI